MQAQMTSKIRNPWPKQKRRAYLQAIEWDLRTYEAVRADLRDLQNEIDEMAAPPAVDIRGSIYAIRHSPEYSDGRPVECIRSRPTRTGNDPTAARAELISEYREQIYCATEYRETIRRIRAINQVLDRLERSQRPDDRLKLHLIKAKYFEQVKTDTAIAEELGISERTFRNWKNGILLEIAKHLGYVI